MIAYLSLAGLILPVIPAGAQVVQADRHAAVIATGVTVGAPSGTQPGDDAKPEGDAKPKTVPMSFSNAPMNQIAKFLTDQLGKPVIVNQEVNGGGCDVKTLDLRERAELLDPGRCATVPRSVYVAAGIARDNI